MGGGVGDVENLDEEITKSMAVTSMTSPKDKRDPTWNSRLEGKLGCKESKEEKRSSKHP